MMNAIAAVSADWGIGRDNDLLFHIHEDMRRFRALTSGSTVIMGRKNLDSLPGGRPLPQRRNIVITRQPNFTREGIEVAHSIDEALRLTEDLEDIWVIGGGEIYAALLPCCKRCCITKVAASPPFDTAFPNLDRLPNWRLLTPGVPKTEGSLTYRFTEYINESL